MDFTITIKPSFEEYKKFNHAVRISQPGRRMKLVVTALILLALAGFFWWMLGFKFACIACAIWTLAAALGLLKAQRSVRKAWDSNALLRENEQILHFTDDGLEVTTGSGSARVDYGKIYRLIETKTHFYIMTAINAGSGFPKEMCTPEQQVFIRERCGR